MTFQQKLDSAILKNNSLLCINLDPDEKTSDLFEFNKKIIDETHGLVCCYKPNSAFYEAQGAPGIEALKRTIDYIHRVTSGLPVILDAKRGDIGNTNRGYVRYAFEYLNADGIVVNPYMGGEALSLFFDQKEKGIVVMCRTSNPGAGELQNLISDGKPLFQHVAEKVATAWNKNGNLMVVVGATYPEELQKVREIVGDMTILVPGIGAQGGDLEKTLKVGLNSKKAGLIIAVGRSIIYSENVKKETEKLRNQINLLKS
ncbi:orotidine 5'-phosphate decarboxylase [Candidatus Roizmanbacteria bacterium RIFCSPHIGHO2_02_FULL_37_13b]|uniref:Orotidine-5'-phosphate decarboxylase n=1 Tax=Candidatus Roizmanbacteria bacterium RIFCSPLOWO2_02_FULL_36_11 TaxID=1802071 RepID=A0A1F7JIS2_9BACT|nr:MAG: orotidine 5'-phosphate decarboxylase [Candidatus Roizmanbacteria bacterium RIFCSPHIGHO2_02_FULL_37_13b]OGK55499.1 MAG: orotidine 5'-phosphate decarboxylase [Candidatus Roizmanbacteria bacterium RIFCSPLOWO2_02_FULL_36_11]